MENLKKVSSFPERLDLIINLTNRRPADVALEANLSRMTISRYLSGQYTPSPRTLVQLAQVLHVSSMWLDGFDVPMAPPSEEDASKTPCLDEESQKESQKALALVAQVLLNPDLLRTVDLYLKLPKEDQFIADTFIIGLSNRNEKAP